LQYLSGELLVPAWAWAWAWEPARAREWGIGCSVHSSTASRAVVTVMGLVHAAVASVVTGQLVMYGRTLLTNAGGLAVLCSISALLHHLRVCSRVGGYSPHLCRQPLPCHLGNTT
jgi:hypothetical protein